MCASVSPRAGEPLIQVAHFSMDAELAPFLSGEALIFDMRLEQPKAKVRLLPDGTLDWARGRKASIPAKIVILENVAITGGQIDFIDEQTGRHPADHRARSRSLGPFACRSVEDGRPRGVGRRGGQLRLFQQRGR